MTIGERIRQVRELIGQTQIGLAKALEVTQSAIAQVENGARNPSEQMISDIALTTGFPVAFFRQSASVDFPLGSLLFRAHATATSTARSQSHRAAEIAFELTAALASKVELLPVRVPRLQEAPSIAAATTRSALELSPDRPINHLVNALEKAGALILSLPNKFDKVDAFSTWAGLDKQRPVIIVCAGTSPDRLRFNVAHELGHLVMHFPAKGTFEELEREAHCFAAEFLLPESAIRAEMVPPVTLTSLSSLKVRWNVSLQALIRRAFDLNIVTERQYRYLFQQLSAKGWRTKEPENLSAAPEKPRAFRKMLELVYGNPPDVSKLCREWSLPKKLVTDIVDAHATAAEMPRNTALTRPNSRVIRFAVPKKERLQ